MEAFAVAPGVAELLARGSTKSSVRMRDGLQADLRVVTEPQFATALHHFTGASSTTSSCAASRGQGPEHLRVRPGAPGRRTALQPESEEPCTVCWACNRCRRSCVRTWASWSWRRRPRSRS